MDSFFVDLSTAFCSYFISKADILNPKRLIANDDYICIYDVLCIWLFVLSNKCFRLLTSQLRYIHFLCELMCLVFMSTKSD